MDRLHGWNQTMFVSGLSQDYQEIWQTTFCDVFCMKRCQHFLEYIIQCEQVLMIRFARPNLDKYNRQRKQDKLTRQQFTSVARFEQNWSARQITKEMLSLMSCIMKELWLVSYHRNWQNYIKCFIFSVNFTEFTNASYFGVKALFSIWKINLGNSIRNENSR